MLDYLIVGQGIAGTNFAHAARMRGRSIMVVDEFLEESATRVSAGLINPITGRKFVKSWLTDQLLPAAFEAYAEMETLLGMPVFMSKNIVRAFANSKDENNWEVRASVPSYTDYIESDVDIEIFKNIIKPAYGYGAVKRSGHIAVNELLDAYRIFLKKEEQLLEERFDYKKLTMTDEGIVYENIKARKVVFCDGMGIKQNPYFNYLPVQGNKGEVLMIRIPDFEATKIIKQGIFLVPFGDNIYWAGSNYTIHFEDDQPSEAGRQALVNKLNDILKVPYEILRHRAAIRPTVPNRRPLIGVHPIFKDLILFNGMGTKGASLSPYLAKELLLHLEEEKALNKDVDIQRYSEYFDNALHH